MAIGHNLDLERLTVVAGLNAVAFSAGERWHIRGANVQAASMVVPDGYRVIGVVTESRLDDPAVVVRSASGTIVRLISETTTKTLTRWSGVATDHAVHPGSPWIAVQRDAGHVEVGNLLTGELLLRVDAE